MKTERRHREKDRERIRGREKKRKERRNSYDDDYDDEESGISGWKLGLVVGVIVVCFAMLYPTLFHPMLMGFLGRSQDTKPSINQQRPPVHPAMGGGGSRHPGAGGHPSRPDMHPAMRMAQAQAEGQGSGTKGMFTWMLPVYTVGVVIFLLYTLFKSKSKGKKRRRGDNYYNSDNDDDDSEVDTRYGAKFGKKKLQGLQERLSQTEDAMAKILEQLEAVQNGSQPIDLDAAEKVIDTIHEDMEEEEVIEKKNAVGFNEKNEQYINDLEKALKEFQALSKEYDKAKLKKIRRDIETSEDEDSEDELNSQSESESEMSEEDEEEEEVVPAKSSKKTKKVEKKEKQKKQLKAKKSKKSTSEEEDEEVEKEKKISEQSEEEEEGFDVDTELKEQAERDKKSTVRRRKPKKT